MPFDKFPATGTPLHAARVLALADHLIEQRVGLSGWSGAPHQHIRTFFDQTLTYSDSRAWMTGSQAQDSLLRRFRLLAGLRPPA